MRASIDARRVDLFAAAAERAAMTSGRPKAQELLEIRNPAAAEDFGARWACICGRDLASAAAACAGCGR